jgi:hypothetical protein
MAQILLIQAPFYNCIKCIRQGIPVKHSKLFWQNLTTERLTMFYYPSIPNGQALAHLLVPQDPFFRRYEQRVLYFLKQTVSDFDRSMVARFLHFVSSRDIMPDGPIDVVFHAGAPYLRAKLGCNTLSLSTDYECMGRFQEDLVRLLMNDDAF